MKKWYESKGMILGIVTAAAGWITLAIQNGLQINPIPEPWNGIALVVIGTLAGVIRLKTDAPIGK